MKEGKKAYSLDLYSLDRTTRSQRNRNAHLKQSLEQLQRPRQKVDGPESGFLFGVSFVDVGLGGVFEGEGVGREGVEEVLSCGDTTGGARRAEAESRDCVCKQQIEGRGKEVSLFQSRSAPSGAKGKEQGRQGKQEGRAQTHQQPKQACPSSRS